MFIYSFIYKFINDQCISSIKELTISQQNMSNLDNKNNRIFKLCVCAILQIEYKQKQNKLVDIYSKCMRA